MQSEIAQIEAIKILLFEIQNNLGITKAITPGQSDPISDARSHFIEAMRLISEGQALLERAAETIRRSRN